MKDNTEADRVTAALRVTAEFPAVRDTPRRARSVLRFCVLPAVIVTGLIVAVITFAPGPAAARVSNVNAVSAGSARSLGGAAQTSAASSASLQMTDLKARAAAQARAVTLAAQAKAAAQALADHKFHLAHLAHLRLLSAQAAAAAWAKAHPAVIVTHASSAPISRAPASSGTYSYTMLEQLWTAEGGSASRQSVAACIAEHESGGRANAISPTSDYGLWQINSSNASPSLMLNPEANAREAIALSHDGVNWSPWTTAPDCAGATTAMVTPSGGGIVGFALSFKGYPYVYGGTSPAGFDCSGFAQYVYARFGKSIPRTSEEQAAALTRVSSPSPGDLVFYWSGGDAYHVAIYIGGGEEISALNQSTGVVVESLSWPGSSYSFGALA